MTASRSLAPRLLIASLGSIGQRHLRVARMLLPDAKIAVLRRAEMASAPAPEGADQVFGALDAAAAFAPHAAIIATPAPFRPVVAQALVQADAHLLLEKPLAATVAEANGFVVDAAARDRVLQVGYLLRFSPILGAARRLLVAGEIGAPRLARFEVGQFLPDWRPDADYRDGVSARSALGGGALLELSHEIDLALWMLGAPRTVTASLGQVSDLQIDVEDYATLVLDRPGLSATVQLDMLQRTPRRRLALIGSEGTIEVDLIAQTGVLRDPRGETPLDAAPTHARDELFLRQFDAFCSRTIEGYRPRYADSPAPCDLRQAADVLAVVDAARQAAATGRRQPLGLSAFA